MTYTCLYWTHCQPLFIFFLLLTLPPPCLLSFKQCSRRPPSFSKATAAALPSCCSCASASMLLYSLFVCMATSRFQIYAFLLKNLGSPLLAPRYRIFFYSLVSCHLIAHLKLFSCPLVSLLVCPTHNFYYKLRISATLMNQMMHAVQFT